MPLQILLADAEPATAAPLADTLRRAGFRVRIAPDGRSALRAAAATPPDVVLLDVALPGLDGSGLAGHLAAEEPRPLLVAVTGRGSWEVRAHPDAGAFDLYLRKPVDAGQLLTLLRGYRRLSRPDAPPPAPARA
jgi:two-component system, OmpR family, KDP operon response regulator KdpE